VIARQQMASPHLAAALATPHAAAVLAGQEADWPQELETLTARLKKNNIPHQIAAVKSFEDKVSLELGYSTHITLYHFVIIIF
jgi:hypothetical protein